MFHISPISNCWSASSRQPSAFSVLFGWILTLSDIVFSPWALFLTWFLRSSNGALITNVTVSFHLTAGHPSLLFFRELDLHITCPKWDNLNLAISVLTSLNLIWDPHLNIFIFSRFILFPSLRLFCIISIIFSFFSSFQSAVFHFHLSFKTKGKFLNSSKCWWEYT